MPFVMIDDVNLHFEEAGAGPPMLFLHGWARNLTHLEPQAKHFASTHRVVSVDLRGHGQSDKPAVGYTIASFADDVADLCRELAVDHPVVVGHSMGGAVALELAARYPKALRAAVMMDSACCGPKRSPLPWATSSPRCERPRFSKRSRTSSPRCASRPMTTSVSKNGSSGK